MNRAIPEGLLVDEVVMGRETISLDNHVVLRDVFEASYRRLVMQFYGLTGDWFEAEDLVQEAFVRAAAAGRRFTRTDNPEAWLRTTAVNLHRSRWRKRRNFARVRDQMLSGPTDLPGAEARLDVIAALRRLPTPYRQVVALHHLADLSVAEIAETLDLPQGTVKSRLKRGRDALAAMLTAGEEIGDV